MKLRKKVGSRSFSSYLLWRGDFLSDEREMLAEAIIKGLLCRIVIRTCSELISSTALSRRPLHSFSQYFTPKLIILSFSSYLAINKFFFSSISFSLFYFYCFSSSPSALAFSCSLASSTNCWIGLLKKSSFSPSSRSRVTDGLVEFIRKHLYLLILR